MNCIIDCEINCSCHIAAATAGSDQIRCARFFQLRDKLIDTATNLPCIITTPGIGCPKQFIFNEEKHGWLLRQNNGK